MPWKWELTDESIAQFKTKLERSHLHPKLIPYLWELEKRNYATFDRLVMLCLHADDMAFVYGVGAVLNIDPDAGEYREY